jgi:serine/threonine-protein kinase RsbW
MRFIKLFARKLRATEESELDIETALRESLANSVIHGTHEDHKQVYITCRFSTDGEIMITVRDQGQGFDSRVLPDPSEAKNRLLRHGRGIYLMRALMDEVCFEENGRLVRMRKNLGALKGTFPK